MPYEFYFTKLLTDGGIAGALIVTVVLFLKQLDKINSLIGEITKTFNITISGLVKDHTSLTRETVSAVKDMTAAVQRLDGRVVVLEEKIDGLSVPDELK